jgi:ATP-dependent DNA helicase RecQ
VVVEPRRQWPSGLRRPDALEGRLLPALPGRAVAFADDPAWRPLIAELAGPDAEPSSELKDALVQVLRRWSRQWDERPVAVVPMASRSRPLRVAGMARHLAEVGRLFLLAPFDVAGPAPDTDVAAGVRAGQLAERLHLNGNFSPPPGPVLLVDDFSRTRWTLTVASALLRSAGAPAVLPLVGQQRP